MKPQQSATAAAGGFAGAAVILIQWLIQILAGITVPDNVSVALTVLLGSLAGFVTHEFSRKSPPPVVSPPDGNPPAQS